MSELVNISNKTENWVFIENDNAKFTSLSCLTCSTVHNMICLQSR
jgi:hypothetical protein